MRRTWVRNVFYYILLNSVIFMFYSILLYSVLLYSILFYPILFYSILFYSILFYSIPFHSILFHSIPFHSILFHSIPSYSMLLHFWLLILFNFSSGPSGWVVWLSSSWYTEQMLKSHSGDSTRPCGNIQPYIAQWIAHHSVRWLSCAQFSS